MDATPFTRLSPFTEDGTASAIEQLKALFPKVVSEGKVDFDLLHQLLSSDLIEGEKERYRLEWPGKRKALLEARRPISKTLRPLKDESVNFDTTENLYIEGDNLEVLKLLQKAYHRKVKMIYIDPPYNTGNEFIYRDDFKHTKVEEAQASGIVDDEGRKTETQDPFQLNNITSGTFHSDWLSMMFPRLTLAKNLLTDDGVIFISIDDHEVARLRLLCDTIFGEQNFIAQLIWQRAFAPKNDAKYISNSHDYVLMYARSLDAFKIGRLPRTAEANARYDNPDNDPRGVWMSDNLTVKTYSPSGDYPITTPSGRVIEPPAGRCWRLAKNEFLARLHDNRIWFGSDGNGVPRIKRFLSELRFDGMAPTSLLLYKEVGHSQEGAQEVVKLLGGGYFDGPKPTRLLKHLLTLANLPDDAVVLDFFSGSGSMAQALMKFNAEKGGKRKFIMVQYPEACEKEGEAFKAGYSTITELAKARIRKAGAKILEADPALEGKLDVGFRVLKVDSSNQEVREMTPAEWLEKLQGPKEDLLEDLIKGDRSEDDLLFQAIANTRDLPFSSRIAWREAEGVRYAVVAEGDLVACFAEKGVTPELAQTLAKLAPLHAVFRESALDDTLKVNLGQIFKQISPTTHLYTL